MLSKSKLIGIMSFCVLASICAFVGAYVMVGTGRTPFQAKLTTSPANADDPAQPENAAEQVGAVDNTADNAVDMTASEPEIEVKEAMSSEDKISKDTTIVYEYYYSEDDKTLRSEQLAPHHLLDLTRVQFAERLADWRIVSFSPKEVVIRKNAHAADGEKYILGIWDGYIAVFNSDITGGKSLMEVTDTPVSALSEAEQKKLNDGITIEGENDLMKVLEDYGS